MTERSLVVVLALIGVVNAALGALALIVPDTFFDQIGKYGVENSHYVGDVGAFVIAFGLAVLVSVRLPSWRGPVLYLGAIWFGFPALNHAFHTHGAARPEGSARRRTAHGRPTGAGGGGGPTLSGAAGRVAPRRYLSQSIAFIYEPEGDWVKDEEARPFVKAPGRFASGVEPTLTS